MKKAAGRGVLTLLSMCEGLAKRAGEDETRSFVDGLENEEIADVAVALSEARRAVDGSPGLLFESLAARVRGVDVAAEGSLQVDEWRHRCNAADRTIDLAGVVLTCGLCGAQKEDHITPNPEH